jgi:mono/diheme cytochrome c family protein
MRSALFIIVMSFLMSGCTFSLAGDVTPPPEAAISDQATATPRPIEFPASPPDLANGVAVYAENCAPCHGVSGLGDGAQAAALPFAPAPIGTHKLAADAKPEDWYQIISNGNLDHYMPPFAARLSAQERWDVLAYVYSLSQDQALFQRGKELAVQYSEELSALVPNLDNLSQIGAYSQSDLISKLQTVLPNLSQDDRQALAAYIQSVSLGGAVAANDAGQATTEAAQPGALTGAATFSGKVVDGTDGNLPAGLQAILFAYDHVAQAFTQTVDVQADGTFDFPDVPLAANRTFFVEIDYAGQSYFSEFLNADSAKTEFETPITIYETTTDVSQLAVEKLTLVFDFPQAGKARVVEQVTISNIGDRAVAPGADGQPVLHFSLPADASNLVFQDGALGDRYVAEPGGFGDLRAALPGQQSYQLIFAYDLPYRNGLRLPLKIDLPTRSVLVLIPNGNVNLQSGDFQSAGVQQIQEVDYQSNVSARAFFPGDEVNLQLRGPNPAGGGLFDFVNDDSVLIGLAALTLAVGVTWIWLRRTQPPAETSEQVMDEIIKLDQRHEKGRISGAEYKKKRAALKSQLRLSLKGKK